MTAMPAAAAETRLVIGWRLWAVTDPRSHAIGLDAAVLLMTATSPMGQMLRCARTSEIAMASSDPITARTRHGVYESAPFVTDKELSKNVCLFAIFASLPMSNVPE